MYLKNKSNKPGHVGEMSTDEWKTEMATRREELELLNNPLKKQKVERLLVDEVDDLLFDRKCVTMSTHDNSVRNAKDYYNSCNVYECDNLTKYKTAINKTDNLLYALSAQYGWQICDQNVQRQFPPIKVRLTRANPGKEIVLIVRVIETA